MGTECVYAFYATKARKHFECQAVTATNKWHLLAKGMRFSDTMCLGSFWGKEPKAPHDEAQAR